MAVVPASSRATSSGGGAISQLFDLTLGADSATLDTGAGGFAQTANHLWVIATIRCTDAAKQTVTARLNADATAGHYGTERVTGGDASASAGNDGALAGINVGVANGTGATAGFIPVIEFMVPNYAQAVIHEILGTAAQIDTLAATANWLVRAASGVHNQAVAINRITLVPLAGNVLAGSRITVYGLT